MICIIQYDAKIRTRPVTAAVIVCLLWSVFFASPLPADTIKLKPPKINKTRKITPAITKAFLSSTLTNAPIVGNDFAGVKISRILTVGTGAAAKMRSIVKSVRNIARKHKESIIVVQNVVA